MTTRQSATTTLKNGWPTNSRHSENLRRPSENPTGRHTITSFRPAPSLAPGFLFPGEEGVRRATRDSRSTVYILKPKEGIVANLEYAEGEGSSYGHYLKLGYAF